MVESNNQIEKYAEQSLHYLNNAAKYIDKEDIGKASEFLWGSVAQAVKALAASKGFSLKKYSKIRDFVMQLSRELDDSTIYSVYMNAYALHLNFYEMDMDMTDIRRMSEDIRKLVGKILHLIPGQNSEIENPV